MPSLLIRHHVADYSAWKAGFDEHAPTRRAYGAQGEWLFRDADDPQQVLLLLEWDDLERARLFVDSDDLREAMNRGGVVDRPDIWFLQDVDRPIGEGAIDVTNVADCVSHGSDRRNTVR
jgi:hypothetical protein